MKKNIGFTLIEILIALTIFSIMAAITSSVLYSVFQSRDKSLSHALALSKMQMAFVLIERDFKQITRHPIKTSLAKEPSVLGFENKISFTRGGIVNPLSAKKQSTLSRVSYLVEGEHLIRQNNKAVDRNTVIMPHSESLLSEITTLKFNYIDDNNQLLTQWYNKKLPKAIRITIDSKHWGKLSQIYSLNQSRHYYAKI